MDLKGSLVDTKLKIYPTETLITYLHTIPDDVVLPENVLKISGKTSKNTKDIKINKVQITSKDLENLNKVKEYVKSQPNDSKEDNVEQKTQGNGDTHLKEEADTVPDEKKQHKGDGDKIEEDEKEKQDRKDFLTTSDIEWLYSYLQKQRSSNVKVPYLHELLEGINIEMPENRVIKRNPVLEARCVKLRAQQEARDYRKMTKTVDNVRMRFPEDSISYQLKQLNRQLIAIGQFIISIFAGFLFGFRGVELMVGNLDFGFRLLLGVMCALVIALAEIYFLAKKLNEELNIPETVQLGGPPKFVQPNEQGYVQNSVSNNEKEHQD